MLKRLLNWLLPGSKIRKPNPSLRAGYITIGEMSEDEKIFRENEQTLALSNLNMQYEALQKGLTFTHRTVIITFIAALGAIVIGVIAIRSKPVIQIYDQKTSKVQIDHSPVYNHP